MFDFKFFGFHRKNCALHCHFCALFFDTYVSFYVYFSTQNSQNYASYGFLCFTWFYYVKEYCKEVQIVILSQFVQVRDTRNVCFGCSLIWRCWIFDICFDFFKCCCLRKTTINIRYLIFKIWHIQIDELPMTLE